MTSLYIAIVQNNLGFFIKYIVKTSPLSELIKIEKAMSLPGKNCNTLIKIIHIHLKEVYEF